MGLLDDAIREHLELKRQRGADPSEVARDERAALGSPEAEGDEGYDLAEPDFAESAGELDGYDEESPAVEGADRRGGEAGGSAGADMPLSSEETMEVDMRTIIDADLGRDDAERELNGEAMAANAVTCGGGAGRTSGGWGVDPKTADSQARERHRWLGARSVRALGLSGGPAAEGSLP